MEIIFQRFDMLLILVSVGILEKSVVCLQLNYIFLESQDPRVLYKIRVFTYLQTGA